MVKNISLSREMLMMNKSITHKYFILTSGLAMGIAMFNPILYIFLLNQGFTYSELGIYLSLFFLFSFLTEVPCGAITDVIGIKKTLLLSCIFRATGLMFLLTQNFYLLLMSALFSAIAESFQSGTLQSWLVNSLDEIGKKGQISKIFSRSMTITSLLTLIVGFISSKFLFKQYQSMPVLASIIVFALVFLIVWRVFPKALSNKLNIISVIKASSLHLKSTIFKLSILKSSSLLIILLLMPSILDAGPSNQWQSVFYTTDLDFLNGYIWIIICVAGMLGSFLSEKIGKIESNKLLFTSLLIVVSLLIITIYFVNSLILKLLIFTIYIVFFAVTSIRMSVILHEDIILDNKSRTTLVSIFYAVESLVMSVAVFLNGVLSEMFAVTFVWTMFAVFILIVLIMILAIERWKNN